MSGPNYEIRITRRAEKDILQLIPKLKDKLFDILSEILSRTLADGKRLIGDLDGHYSLRLTHRDRIVCRIDAKNKNRLSRTDQNSLRRMVD